VSFELSCEEIHFTLMPHQRLFWSRDMRASILRGAFGSILRDIACDPICPGSRDCRFGAECAYQRIFAPRTPENATRLSRNQDLPRPFVLVADDGPNEYVEPGQTAGFLVRLFGNVIELRPYVEVVFSELIHRGFGPKRVPCEVKVVPSAARARSLSLNFSDFGLPTKDLEVSFLTPVALKDRGSEVRVGSQAFGPLVKRTRDRLSALYHFYSTAQMDQKTELPWDFVGLGKAAESIVCVQDKTHWFEQFRRSSRTGQRHELGGIVGRAIYRDVPQTLAQLLQLGTVVHVGKHAAFGLGRIAVSPTARTE